jgi:hypothetical protein
MIAEVLDKQIRRIFLAYVDDTVVTSKRKQDHIAYLAESFASPWATKPSLNPEKCVFGVHKGNVYDFVFTKGIEANADKIKALADMEEPQGRSYVKLMLSLDSNDFFLARLHLCYQTGRTATHITK